MNKNKERNDDRREGFVSPELPFLQDHGLTVSRNRRQHRDRRSSSFNVDRIDGPGKD